MAWHPAHALGTKAHTAARRLLERGACAGARVADYLAPPICLFCDQSSPRDLPICHDCRARLVPNFDACPRCALPDCAGMPCPACQRGDTAVDAVIAPYLYEPSIAYLIKRWKYHGEQRLALSAARLMLDSPGAPPENSALLAMPMHWSRRLVRGYNQADDLLAGLLTLAPGLEAAGSCGIRLRRRRATRRQAGLTAAARRRSLRNAFAVGGEVDGRAVTLVDDVCTTGATAEAAARVLYEAGATQVQLWCLARTPAP